MRSACAPLQRGRTQTSAESGRIGCGMCRCGSFNGAALKRVRKAGACSSGTGFPLRASTGPHSNECGKNNNSRLPSVEASSLQRGRTQTSAESSMNASELLLVQISFNGAALKRVRKVSPCGPPSARSARASTGPHSNECGKQGETGKRRDGAAALQRGRTQTSAESHRPLSTGHIGQPGFNGAALKRVRKEQLDIASAHLPVVASTGPHSNECGKRERHLRAKLHRHASTGPHSNECGKNAGKSSQLARAKLLQRGRTQTSAESMEQMLKDWGIEVLQRGRTQTSAERSPRLRAWRRSGSCFNGAALKRVRKAHGGGGYATGAVASTGPHSNECGKHDPGGS